MNWKKKFMWAASFLVSLFVCGTALAAGNDVSADTSAQGKEENQVYRFGAENNANDITETEASAAESGAADFENKEMYLYEGEWVGDATDWTLMKQPIHGGILTAVRLILHLTVWH